MPVPSSDGGGGDALFNSVLSPWLSELYADKSYRVAALTVAAGVQAGTWLLHVPGASSTVVEVAAPYAREATLAIVEEEDAIPHSFYHSGGVAAGAAAAPALATEAGPDESSSSALQPPKKNSDHKFVSAEFAAVLARAARRRALGRLDDATWPRVDGGGGASKKHNGTDNLDRSVTVLGIGCTGALSSNYERRGASRAFLAMDDGRNTNVRKLEFLKNVGRRQQDLIVSAYLLGMLRERFVAAFAESVSTNALRLRMESSLFPGVAEAFFPGQTVDEVLVLEDLSGIGVGATWAAREHEQEQGAEREGLGADSPGEKQLTFAIQAFLERSGAQHDRVTYATIVLDPLMSGEDKQQGSISSTAGIRFVSARPLEVLTQHQQRPLVLVCGSFNPLHDAHIEMGVAAMKLVGEKNGTKPRLAFELGVTNADKGCLDAAELVRRLKLMQGVLRDHADAAAKLEFPITVLLTANAPLFTKKAEIYRGCTFVVGADTSARILNPKYYGVAVGPAPPDPSHMVVVFARAQCRFLVAGRAGAKGEEEYDTLEKQVERGLVPAALTDMFVGLDSYFERRDVSSTALREQGLSK